MRPTTAAVIVGFGLGACRPAVDVRVPGDVEYFALIHHDTDGEIVTIDDVLDISSLYAADEEVVVRAGSKYVFVGWPTGALDDVPKDRALQPTKGCMRLASPSVVEALDTSSQTLDFELTIDGATDVCPTPLTCVANECVAVAQVVTARGNTCARLASGRVTCTGRNNHGDVGIGSNDLEIVTPTYVEGIDDAIDIDLGHDHACVVHATGRVSCWGLNGSGQVGDNTFVLAVRPTTVVELDDAVELALGNAMSCARSEDGRVRCWGSNGNGQLGTSVVRSSSFPFESNGGHDAVSIASGWNHVCIARSGGSVRCWGTNGGWQLGSTDTTLSEFELPTPTGVVQLEAGDGHTCARTEDGEVYCWGLGRSGQLGNGQTDNMAAVMLVDLPWPVAGLDAGGRNTCAWNAEGVTACWGHGHEGLIEAEDIIQTTPLIQSWRVGRGLSLDFSHVCRLDDATTTTCWGTNQFGEIGANPDLVVGQPRVVVPILRWAGISTGDFHTCGWDANGAVACWGLGLYGAVGQDVFTTIAPAVMGSVQPALHVTSNLFVNCALHATGASCWGRHHFGANVVGPSPDAIEVSGLRNPTAIDTSATHSCAIVENGDVYCWGDGGGGLGLPGTGSQTTPRRTNALPAAAIGIGVGRLFTCAALADETTVCFGDNQARQLGSHTPSGATANVVLGVTNARVIESYESNTCVITESGEVWCWGSGKDGVRAVPQVSAETEPNRIPLPEAAASVSIGEAHACVVTVSNQLYCWGQNVWGQAGIPGPDRVLQIFEPTHVDLPEPIVGVSVGSRHVCAWSGTGNAWCFGDDAYGQLGAETRARIETPTVIEFTP